MSLNQDTKVVQVTTADATATNVTAAAVTLADNREAYVEAFFVLKSGTNAKTIKVGGTVKRASGGSAAVVGTIQSLLTAQGDAGLAAAVASIIASGNDVVPQVTGIALTSITWDCWFTVTYKP